MCFVCISMLSFFFVHKAEIEVLLDDLVCRGSLLHSATAMSGTRIDPERTGMYSPTTSGSPDENSRQSGNSARISGENSAPIGGGGNPSVLPRAPESSCVAVMSAKSTSLGPSKRENSPPQTDTSRPVAGTWTNIDSRRTSYAGLSGNCGSRCALK